MRTVPSSHVLFTPFKEEVTLPWVLQYSGACDVHLQSSCIHYLTLANSILSDLFRLSLYEHLGVFALQTKVITFLLSFIPGCFTTVTTGAGTSYVPTCLSVQCVRMHAFDMRALR